MAKIVVINGPNVGIVGWREPELYGNKSIGEINAELVVMAEQRGIELEFCQSNHEGVLLDKIHECRYGVDAIIINPGGSTSYSVAIRDAIKAVGVPAIVVHISNKYAKTDGDFRKMDMVAPVSRGQIVGLGVYGYKLAFQAALHIMDME